MIEIADGFVNEGDTIYYSSSILMEGVITFTGDRNIIPKDKLRLLIKVNHIRDRSYTISQEHAKLDVFKDYSKASMYQKLKNT
jgi:hypothetical protein